MEEQQEVLPPKLELHVKMGTCSWTDDSLIRCGRFFKSQHKDANSRLQYYSTQCPTVEVDSSTYAIPQIKVTEKLAKLVPDHFVIHFKAFQLFTNLSAPFPSLPWAIKSQMPDYTNEQISLRDLNAELQETLWRRFNEALMPVYREQKLGVVLFQFHFSFVPSPANIEHVLYCRKNLSPLYTMAVEFRSRAWIDERNLEKTLSLCRENNIILVATDEVFEGNQSTDSLAPPKKYRTLLELTNDKCIYIRMHRRIGRERILASVELESWALELKGLVNKLKLQNEDRQLDVYIMWNTNWEDQSFVNMKNMEETLARLETKELVLSTWKAKHLRQMGSVASFFTKEKGSVGTKEDTAVAAKKEESPKKRTTNADFGSPTKKQKIQSPIKGQLSLAGFFGKT